MSKFYKNADNELIIVPGNFDIEVVSDGNTLTELVANSTDGAGEKHVPKVDVKDNLVTVQVGEVPHPMLAEHWINDIVLDTNQGTYAKKLSPETQPVAVFVLDEGEVPETVYEFCNLHGLWKKDL